MEVALIKEALAGKPSAAEQLTRSNYRLVFSFIYRMTGDYHLAEDLTQEVFIKALAALASYRMDGRFDSWLLSIASNRVKDHWRGQRRRPTVPLSEQDAPQEDEINSIIERQSHIEQINKAFGGLSPVQREVIVLRYYHELKLEEIARITNAPVSTVKSRLRQGLLRLRDYLGGEGL
ncbi:MAG: RNA polymerase sigma factor [Firmicutes bacterium]|nr:RNA polymerase sigma factor [Bacillota bacterium]